MIAHCGYTGGASGTLKSSIGKWQHTGHGDALVVVDCRLGEASFLQASPALEQESDSLHPQHCCRVLRETFEVRNGDMLAFDSRHSPVPCLDSWDLDKHDGCRGAR